MRAVFASHLQFMRPFEAPLDTCLKLTTAPFFASLSVHGLYFTVYTAEGLPKSKDSFPSSESLKFLGKKEGEKNSQNKDFLADNNKQENKIRAIKIPPLTSQGQLSKTTVCTAIIKAVILPRLNEGGMGCHHR